MARAQRLWSSPRNPPGWLRNGSASRVQLGEALHRIKRDAGLSPRDRVGIRDDGSVTDDEDGWIGNVHAEA